MTAMPNRGRVIAVEAQVALDDRCRHRDRAPAHPYVHADGTVLIYSDVGVVRRPASVPPVVAG